MKNSTTSKSMMAIKKHIANVVEPRGIDLIIVWLGPALASGAHPRRI
jgi:hypothetical protein